MKTLIIVIILAIPVFAHAILIDDFESDLSPSWQTLGKITVSQVSQNSFLSISPSGVSFSALNEFVGALNYPLGGSAVKQNVSLFSNDTISFDWALTLDPKRLYLPYRGEPSSIAVALLYFDWRGAQLAIATKGRNSEGYPTHPESTVVYTDFISGKWNHFETQLTTDISTLGFALAGAPSGSLLMVDNINYFSQIQPQKKLNAIPEPETFFLIGVAFIFFHGFRRKLFKYDSNIVRT